MNEEGNADARASSPLLLLSGRGLAEMDTIDQDPDSVRLGGLWRTRREPLAAFVDHFKRALPRPLIASPHASGCAAPARQCDDFVPERSARLAAKSKFRRAKPEAQARKVMMKKLGHDAGTEKPDEASLAEFQKVFTLPRPDAIEEGRDDARAVPEQENSGCCRCGHGLVPRRRVVVMNE